MGNDPTWSFDTDHIVDTINGEEGEQPARSLSDRSPADNAMGTLLPTRETFWGWITGQQQAEAGKLLQAFAAAILLVSAAVCVIAVTVAIIVAAFIHIHGL